MHTAPLLPAAPVHCKGLPETCFLFFLFFFFSLLRFDIAVGKESDKKTKGGESCFCWGSSRARMGSGGGIPLGAATQPPSPQFFFFLYFILFYFILNARMLKMICHNGVARSFGGVGSPSCRSTAAACACNESMKSPYLYSLVGLHFHSTCMHKCG